MNDNYFSKKGRGVKDMTITNFKKSCDEGSNGKNTGKSFFEFIADATDIWSNNACLGYVIHGLQNLGLGEKEIEKIVKEIETGFDDLTVDEADQLYCKTPF
ncbi:RuvA C-terminal domain-containing protein (plasmid) [Oscillospiraceae bacterium PP1C4]